MNSAAKRRIGCAVALMVCALLSKAVWAQAPPPGVFSEVPTAVVPRLSPALEPATMRSRVVQVDTQKITAARRGREVLKLNLFDDAVVEVSISRVRPTRTGYFISGRPRGEEAGEVRLVVNGPVMVGTVVTPERKFTIRSSGAGRHVIRQIDPSREPFECEVAEESITPPSDLPAISSIGPAPAIAVASPAVQTSGMPTEDGSEIRIIIAYTPALQAAKGGAAGMRALIDLMIQSANQAFEDGGISPRLVLVHSEMVNYVAAGPRTDLRRLAVSDDGHMDELHELRNRHAADLIHLLTNVPVGAAGSSYRLLSESLASESRHAFAVTATGSEATFTHEIGHNFGLRHDRYVNDYRYAIYPYAFGYLNQKAFEPNAPYTAKWRTIMSYGNGCSEAGVGCRRILRFSNPDQTYMGDPMGVAATNTSTGPDGPADARLTINNAARWVGSFRSEACTDFAVSPSTAIAPLHGGELVFEVDTAPGCLWESSSQSDFLTVTSDSLVQGPSFVSVSVAANGSATERSGTLTVAGNTVMVRQLATDEGVCGRTAAVIHAITRAAHYSGIEECDQVTDEQLARITGFYLHNLGISSLRKGDFDGLTGLTRLPLSSNELTELPDGLFADLVSLRYLHLAHNRLTHLPENLFTGLGKLEELSLNGNQLANLPENLFSGLSSLKELGLHYNALNSLSPETFAGLAGLERLNLFSNDLGELPAGLFSGLSSLEELGLGGNPFSRLPEDLFTGLSNLEHLSFWSNQVAALPPGIFSGLGKLKGLDLTLGKFPTLPTDVFADLASLEDLGFWGGRLNVLPAGIFDGLSNLRELDLYGNDLGELPDGLFAGLARLERLTLGSNELGSLPSGMFSGLTALRDLSLFRNRLDSLPGGIFSGLASLDKLSLGRNRVDPLPLTVSLEKVGESGFKVVVPAGAPFSVSLPVTVTSAGEISGGVGAVPVPVPAGAGESAPLTVTRVTGTQDPVSADFGTLPDPPGGHSGYVFEKDPILPLRILASSLASDATLIDLTLSDGTLDPDFSEDTTSYTATVPNEASSITLTPVTSNPDAIVSFLDGGDQVLVDADVTAQGHQVTLNVGENTIKVMVTAEDTETNLTYELVVKRDGPMNVCSRSPRVRAAILAATGIGECTEVTETHLSEITELSLRQSEMPFPKPWDLAGLTALEEIDLWGSGIRELPAEIFADLGALRKLNLSVNGLSRLPGGLFSSLSALEALDLSRNRLSRVSAEDFAGLDSLLTLQLANNRLSTVPADLFSGLTGLESISLDENRLTNLPPDLFSGLSILEYLRLDDNQLRDVPSGLFSGLTSLFHFSLADNSISQLPDGLFSGLTSLRSVELGRNVVDPFPITLSVEKVGTDQFKVVAPTGLPFDTSIPVVVSSAGQIEGGATDVSISVGGVESPPLRITRVVGTTDAITVDIGLLQEIPDRDTGYALEKDSALPIEVLPLITPGSDASLQQLSTSDGSLDPPFASEVSSYAVSVTNAVESITITAVASAANATMEYRDSNDQVLDDADSAAAGHQVNLNVGENTIKLVVTAEDMIVSQSYTIIVTRESVTQSTGGVCGRTKQVGDAIVAAVADAKSCDEVTDEHLSEITGLDVSGEDIASLQAGDFGGLAALELLKLSDNDLTVLPVAIFAELAELDTLELQGNQLTRISSDVLCGMGKLKTLDLSNNSLPDIAGNQFLCVPELENLQIEGNRLSEIPDGFFFGLSSLAELDLDDNTVKPLPLTLTLEKVDTDRFKAVAPAGAPFRLVLPVSVSSDGEIAGGVSRVTIPAGALESAEVEVTRVSGATAAVTVDLGTLPDLPANHDGYAFEESGALPVEILPTTVSAEAELGDLSLSDGTLDPVFASGTTSYTASVENAVSSVTVTPAKGDTNATLEYLDSDDSTLADADTGTEGHQVDLEVGENTFKVKVTAEDTTTTQTYVIVVTREEVVRNAPVIVTTSPIAVAENQTEVATLEATDADGDEITWSTSGGADEDNFDLTSAGVLTFVSGRDFEAPGDDDRNNEYVVEVSASDQITDATTLTLIVEVTDVEEDDPTIRDARLSRLELSDGSLSPVFASNTTSYTVKVVSGVSSITVTPTASHAGASVRFLDASDQVKEDDDTGADGHQVNLDAGENTFKVEVKSSDGTVTQSYTVLVTRNRLPAVTSTSPLSVEENETAVTTLAATDADGDAIRWSAKAVEDAVEFDVNANGSIVFTTAPDYENPADSGGNNEYVLIVLASDGTETVEWTLTVNVTDVHEPSTDATLSSLSLSDATLDPVFASGTTRYTASVENAVSSVTVTPAAGDDAATVEYLDSDDSTLADADSGAGGQQVALEVGENTFKVKVTAEDETTTTTYTLAVARQSPAQSSTDVCERTARIRDAIVAAVPGVSACADLTAAHLSAITSLDMTGDNISSLQSGDFAGLTALETIGLYDNELTRLPADIFSGLSTLENLHLGGNGLSVLPSGVFSDLTALEILGLYENQLSSLPARIFSGLSALVELRLGDNELSALPASVFSDLTALEELGLYGNKLSSLRADTFSNLSALEELTLSNNKLDSLRAKVFANLGALEKLTLGNNELSSLPAGIFSGLGALTELSLGGNTVDPLLLTVSLEKVGSSGFKAVAPAGAPFALGLPVSVSSAGELAGGVSRVTIPAGALESAEVEVTRVSGATAAVTVDLGTLPGLPANHDGYAFEESGTLPVEILPPGTPPDATLSGLSLSDGTLDPVFASATTSYTASVENAVSSVTVTPAKGDTNATLEYLDSDDSTLADADTGSEGHQVDLEVGDTTFKVKVTAEDTTTTRTYTIVVTRDEELQRAPVIVTTSPISVAENQTAVATLEATDADGDEITWSTSGGADEALFDLTSAGVLSFLTAPDFEAPSDANGDNEYVVVVEASDEITDATTLTLTIAVSDVSETPAQSDDATLSGLSLSDGTLDPVFASATTSYTASVENAVSSLTVTPAKGDTNATLEYLDSDDSTLADADTGTTGHQVDLDVGENTFKVKVTAEDTTTTQTYAIVVTRESAVEVAGGVCERTAQVRDAIVAAVSGVDACKGVSEAHLLAITSLGMTSNEISSLQSGDFAGLTALETLGLYDNELTSLPAEIFSGLSALKNLHLGANSLSELPAGIFSDLTALEVLGLFDNELIRLRARVFSGLSALEELRLGSNALTTLPSGVFSGLTKLEVLGLYGNDLDNLRAATFSNLRALEELTLSNNKLDRLRARLFANLAALERLTLGSNKFDSLRADTFNNLGALQELTLNDNKLSSLPAGIFSDLTALDSLDLSGNRVDPMPLTVSLEAVGSDQFKAVAPAGAPFSLDLPVTVSSGGEIDGDADSVTISTGAVESGAVAVTRVAGTTAAVTVNIGTLPSLPTNHTGYALEKDDSLPLTVLSAQSSGSTAGEIADASGADVNGNGRIEGDDAMIIYHAYESAGRVGDGETGGSPAARQMLLSGLADAPGASDDELREMLRKANTWRAAGVGAGGDINGDGLIDGADALAMYYAFEFEDLVGDGEIGGSARFRRSLMGELSGKPNPGDADLKTLLRNAHALGRKASPLGRRASPPSTSTSP